MRLADVLFYLQAEVLLVGLALIVFGLWIGLWLLHLVAIIYGKWRLHRKVASSARELPLPGVSILKPLVGVDSNLYSNLESFFTMQYPKFELCFCVHGVDDASLMLVRSLMEKYPLVDARIFVGGEAVGFNPKINNLMPAYRAARHELVLVSDSGIRMKEDTLTDLALAMADDVAIVTQMPFCCDRKGFAGTLEKVYFGTGHARIYLVADSVGIICSTGMSSLMRKAALDDCGGIQAFGCYLAEDYFFAKAVVNRGWKCAVSSQPAWQNSGICEVAKFQDRLCRWVKLRVAMMPHIIVLEPIQDCMLLGLVASWAVNLLFAWNSLIFFLIHVLVWMLLDYVLLLVVQNGALPFGKFEFVVCWLFREVAALPTFLRALWEPRIFWKTGTFRLRWGGFVERLPDKR